MEFQVHAACGLTCSPSLKSTLEVHVLVKGPHGGRITERERHRERVVTEREREREKGGETEKERKREREGGRERERERGTIYR